MGFVSFSFDWVECAGRWALTHVIREEVVFAKSQFHYSSSVQLSLSSTSKYSANMVRSCWSGVDRESGMKGTRVGEGRRCQSRVRGQG
uniref:Uncharacterized protein n=1 Tax=Nelumbo nucifera TaxID=4432 RepID=A0A822Z2X4_NELNU|nr:TPA_asm: hypothetical protein HUJ06_006488 [Nelumbo nucifera]